MVYILPVIMSAQYADVGIKHESSEDVSDCEKFSDGRSYEESSDPISDSDGGTRYKFPSPPPKPMVQLDSAVNLSVPRSKITSRRSTSAAQNDPVFEISESGNNFAGASVTYAAIIPKKRRYIDSNEGSNSASNNSASGMGSDSTTKNPVEEVNRELPIKKSGNKPKKAIKKSRKNVTWTMDSPPVKKELQHVKRGSQKANPTDKPPLEKRHEDVKKQRKTVSTRQSINEEHSTSLASDMRGECVNVLLVADPPPSNKVPTIKALKADRFWQDTMASDFGSSDYEMLLKKSHFTEEQAVVIKQSFHLICRKLHIASTYTDRFMKTHSCVDCHFSISHQCVSVHFSQFVRSNANVVSTTTIVPESMNICICGFGFFHSHANNSRDNLTNNLSSLNISRLFEHDRSLNVSCSKCYMNIVIKNRNNNICSDLTNWIDVFNRLFWNFLKDRLELSSMHKPNLNELYTCRRRCCQIFHRCPEKAAPHDDYGTPLSPVTTYTRTLVTRTND